MKKILFLISIVFLSSCTSDDVMEREVLKRASFDLNCPKNKISIEKLDDKLYGVKGCKKRESYILRGGCAWESGCQPLKEGNSAREILRQDEEEQQKAIQNHINNNRPISNTPSYRYNPSTGNLGYY